MKEFEMLSYEDMPEDNQDLAKIEIAFPYLPDNSPNLCPVSINEILEYLELETDSEEPISNKGLVFLRTAQVVDEKYWIWEFWDNENEKCYVTVSQSQNGSTSIGYDEDYYHLTPEQFILGTFHNVF
jgi:hypothetical protein